MKGSSAEKNGVAAEEGRGNLPMYELSVTVREDVYLALKEVRKVRKYPSLSSLLARAAEAHLISYGWRRLR